MLPRSARRYARTVAQQKAEALVVARRSWRNMGSEFDPSWSMVGPSVLAATVVAQDAIVAAAGEYVPAVLAETGQRVAEAQWRPDRRAWGGTAGDGRSVQSLSYGAVTHAKVAVGQGATTYQALAAGGAWLSRALDTALSDTARSAERLHSRSRHKPAYVRMLSAGACGRCIILAGRRYYTAFERHPNCACVSIPASEAVAGDLMTDPLHYLDSLDDDELAKALGSRANAVAYREFGADPNQIVNAYRARWLGNGEYAGSVNRAQVFGRNVRYTTEGVTRRGWAGQSMRGASYVDGSQGRLKAPRLMPDSIFDISKDRAETERLLKLYGWIL